MISMNPQDISHELVDHWVLLGLTCTLCYFCSVTIYNIYFHPLASYPGPFLARISALPSFLHSVKGNRHIWIWQCHQIYGNTCRIQPNLVVWNSPSAYRSIYSNKVNVRKADVYKIWRREWSKNISTLTEVDKTIHAQKKKRLMSVFTDKSIRSAETFIVGHVDRCCDLLLDQGKNGEPINIAHLADYLVFDIMCDLSFGKSFDVKESPSSQLRTVPHTFENYTAFMSNIARSPFLPAWLWFKSHGLDQPPEYARPKDMMALFALIRTSIVQRLHEEEHKNFETEDGRKDIFHYLFHAKDTETGKPAFSNNDLALEAQLLLTTGLGTTATTLSAFFFYITRNKTAYQRLIKEIRGNFSSADEIQSSSKLSSCFYLRACLDETLRMTPAAPGELLRTILPGGLNINDQFLPEGTLVGISSWSLFHSDESYPDPWVYRPERWIVDKDRGVGPEDVLRAQAAFFPFSIGPVSCVGQRLAKSILLITIAKIMWRMDVVSLPDSHLGEGSEQLGWGRRDKNVFQIKDGTFALREGPIVQFMEKNT